MRFIEGNFRVGFLDCGRGIYNQNAHEADNVLPDENNVFGIQKKIK